MPRPRERVLVGPDAHDLQPLAGEHLGDAGTIVPRPTTPTVPNSRLIPFALIAAISASVSRSEPVGTRRAVHDP